MDRATRAELLLSYAELLLGVRELSADLTPATFFQPTMAAEPILPDPPTAPVRPVVTRTTVKGARIQRHGTDIRPEVLQELHDVVQAGQLANGGGACLRKFFIDRYRVKGVSDGAADGRLGRAVQRRLITRLTGRAGYMVNEDNWRHYQESMRFLPAVDEMVASDG